MFSYGVVVFLLSSTIALERPSVTTKLGSIIGYHKKSYDGRTYSSFEGIPYAKPPLGQLRFEAPEEPDPWEEALDANKNYVCAQTAFLSQNATGTEDCLYLNVYVPKEAPNHNDNFEVFVHIHGGAFMVGTSTMSGPLFFMDRDVIFVNFNYRLGALGFLSTEDDVVPGNNGLKDQRLALQWIQNNIKQFGGNPNSVTITGASAGGASVHFHYFSKMSKGLFHRGISQSGTTLAPWTIQRGALERAKALSVLLGCSDTTTTRTFIDCMKEKPSEEIVLEVTKLYSPAVGFPIAPFAPVVEGKSDSAFLTDYPMNLLISRDFNDVPWITSMCTDEGGLVIPVLYKEIDELNDKFNELAHYYLDYNYTTCDCDKKDVAQKIREKYFGTQEIGKATYKSIIQLFGDRMFGVNIEKSARIQARVSKSKIYSYVYGYKNSFADDYIASVIGSNIDVGVGHVEDAQLLYGPSLMDDQVITSNLSETDVLIKDMMINMYVSFATNNAPIMNGLVINDVSSSNAFTYLSIKGTTDIKMNVTEELTPIKFWESLPIIEDEQLLPEVCNKCVLKKKYKIVVRNLGNF